MGQGANGGLHLAETTVKPLLQLGHGDVRCVLVVENRERQAKFSAELFEGHFGLAGLGEDVVGRLPDCG